MTAEAVDTTGISQGAKLQASIWAQNLDASIAHGRVADTGSLWEQFDDATAAEEATGRPLDLDYAAYVRAATGQLPNAGPVQATLDQAERLQAAGEQMTRGRTDQLRIAEAAGRPEPVDYHAAERAYLGSHWPSDPRLQHNWAEGESAARESARTQALAEAARQQGADIADDPAAERAYVEHRWPGTGDRLNGDDEQAAARAFIAECDEEVGRDYAAQMAVRGLPASDVTTGATFALDTASPAQLAEMHDDDWDLNPGVAIWVADLTGDPWADQ